MAREEVINPYLELRALKLAVADLTVLAPYLAKEEYMLAFSYWRDFHPDRTLHLTAWPIAELIDEAARRDLADLSTLYALPREARPGHVKKVLAWCKANAGKSGEQLVLDAARTANELDFVRPGGGRIGRLEKTSTPWPSCSSVRRASRTTWRRSSNCASNWMLPAASSLPANGPATPTREFASGPP